jgi:hypothetical protein
MLQIEDDRLRNDDEVQVASMLSDPELELQLAPPRQESRHRPNDVFCLPDRPKLRTQIKV